MYVDVSLASGAAATDAHNEYTYGGIGITILLVVSSRQDAPGIPVDQVL